MNIEIIKGICDSIMKAIAMGENYEERKIDHSLINGAIIDTCAINDSKKPYETTIMHPDYRDGNWIIIELYDTKKEAKTGHDKWVETISKGLPSQLVDVNECSLEDLAELKGCTCRGAFERKIHKE